jgi:hypothetical protein
MRRSGGGGSHEHARLYEADTLQARRRRGAALAFQSNESNFLNILQRAALCSFSPSLAHAQMHQIGKFIACWRAELAEGGGSPAKRLRLTLGATSRRAQRRRRASPPPRRRSSRPEAAAAAASIVDLSEVMCPCGRFSRF